MVTLGRRNIAIIFMLAWLVLSPYALTTNNIGHTIDPIKTMELAAPTISGPAFLEFENGSFENVVYTASDPDPKNYSLTVDGNPLDSGIWDGDDITAFFVWIYRDDLIDTLPKTLTLVCTVFNNQEESASATTTLSVILDETAPIVEQPANITYEDGSFGHEILWNITESNPDFYNITRTSNEPTSNNTVIQAGSWDGSNITINVDGLNVSRWYLYSLFLSDIFGRNTTSIVNVTVVPDLSYPTVTSPEDLSFEFGDEGFEILWHAFDSNPKNYSITAVIHYNDTTYGNIADFHTFIDVEETEWTFTDSDGGDIILGVDSLFLGNYTVTLTLFDDFDRMTNDSVNVTIYRDVRAPIITPSGDFSYEEGYTGYSINWTVEESNPLSFNLTLDGDVHENGTWLGEEYILSIDGLSVGVYVYNMTYTDFFNQSAFALIQVEVTADAHVPVVAELSVFQTFSTATTNNLTIHAYVWDLNNISNLEVQWGVGDPEDVAFEFETKDMEQSEIENMFMATIGEYKHGVVVWYKVVAQDDSSVQLEFDTGWIAVEITGQGIDRPPALLYAGVIILGALSLFVIFIMYFRTKTR